jgi:catechol 2,3-dioxygenase-like lactoylglutathione lyase family enzyme
MKRLNPSGDHQVSRIALSRRQLRGGLAGLAAASSTAQAAPLFRPSQLNHLTLNVSDLERSRAFYSKLFGGPQWTVSPALESFDLGANPLGLYLNPRGTPVGIDHFCIGLRDFNGDAALSTLKQQSMDAQKAVNDVGIQFRDLDRIKLELVPENYRNPRAEPQKGQQPPVQSLFRPVGLNHVTLQVAQSGESHEVLRIALWAVFRPEGTEHYPPAGDGITRIDQLRREPGWRGSILCVGRRV